MGLSPNLRRIRIFFIIKRGVFMYLTTKNFWLEQYDHAIEQLRVNDWDLADLVCEHYEDREIWFSSSLSSIIIEEVYPDLTLRIEFLEDTPEIVSVYTCHKCNQSGCVFSEPEFECNIFIG